MLAIYSPDVPPRHGGVADQTLELARALDRLGRTPIVLALRGDPAAFVPVPCVTGVRIHEAPTAAVQHGARRLLLQYVPFLYARHGIAPSLLRLAARCSRAGIALDLFVHEPFVPFTRLPWLLTGLPQRLQLRALVRSAASVRTPVPAFASLIRRWSGGSCTVSVAPVGSAIPAAGHARREPARMRLGIATSDIAIGVFSPGAAGFRGDWIRAAAARLTSDARVRWVVFGSGSDGFKGMPQDRTIVVREHEANTMAETMRAMDLAAQPYEDGLTLRRTSAMLAIATGTATASSTGPLYDPAAGALAVCAADEVAFTALVAELAHDPVARAAAAGRTAGYDRTASVEALARDLLRQVEAGATT
jgi:glycosyltransferase involved in cell wall biosynthesis